MYSLRYSNQYKRDLKKIYKQGKDLKKLKFVINQLQNGKKLDKKYKDHKLKNSGGIRDCHIEPDWILEYKIEKNQLILLLIRNGSHAELQL